MLANICIHQFLIGKISKVVPQLLTKGQLGPCTLPQAKLVPKLLNFDSVTSSHPFFRSCRQFGGDRSHEKTNMPSFFVQRLPPGHPATPYLCASYPVAFWSRPRGTPATLLADSRHSRPRAPPAGLLVIAVSDLLRLRSSPAARGSRHRLGRDGRTSHDPESDPRRGEMEVRHPWRFCGSNRFLFCLSCLPALIF